ncbi:MAG: phosphonate metabolism protein/1,5-bisphosphokinase (PRPP-forming) PhnN [Pseudomonadota bacterium]
MTGSGAGRLLAFVGPSGVGKDSVMQALVAARPDMGLVKRVITRAADEVSEHSMPVDETTFEAMVAEGAFALRWRAHGLAYGIPVSVDTDLAAGRTMLVNLSRAVLPEAQARFGVLTVIHLTAPPAVLAVRLAGRGRENASDIEKRLARAGDALPPGLRDVVQVSNTGPLEETVRSVLERAQPERA